MVRFHFDRRSFTIVVIEQDNHILLDFDISKISIESQKNQKILEKYIARSFNQLILDVEWSLGNIKNSMDSEAYEYGGGIWYKMEVKDIFWNQKRIRYILRAAQLKKKKCKDSDIFEEKTQNVKNGSKILKFDLSEESIQVKSTLRKNSQKVLKIRKCDIRHYNRWFTDRIKNYLKNINSEVAFLFKPFNAFSRMNLLFGLNKNYLIEQRHEKNSKNIIAKSILNKMRKNFSKKVREWMLLHQDLINILLIILNDIIHIIDDYEKILNPLPKPHYQTYNYHPNFNRDYFSEIQIPRQAYLLGFLFADGYITLEHKSSGDYFRIGLGLSKKEEMFLISFCESIGLNPEYIKTSNDFCSYTGEYTPIIRIRWGDQKMAKDLINLGMNYEFNEEKGRRVKKPTLPLLGNETLMLCFLLGFYDGDGSLGFTKFRKKSRVNPTIISSNNVFLFEIKKYYNIKHNINSYSYEKYDFKKEQIVETAGFRLFLGIDLFRKMLVSYPDSFERKRVSISFLDEQSISAQRLFLGKVLKKGEIEQISQFLSANRIGNLLGIDHRTIISFAREEYGINFKATGYYTSINNSLRWHGTNSPYYNSMTKWINYLNAKNKFPKD